MFKLINSEDYQGVLLVSLTEKLHEDKSSASLAMFNMLVLQSMAMVIVFISL